MLNSISVFRTKNDQRFTDQNRIPFYPTAFCQSRPYPRPSPHQTLPGWAVPNGARNRPRLPIFPTRTTTFQQKTAPSFQESAISAPVPHFDAIPAPGKDHIWQRYKGRSGAPAGWGIPIFPELTERGYGRLFTG